MDNFIGKWQLKENINLDEFLIYYQYSWLKRKSALASNVDLILEKVSNNSLKRTIDSTFMKSDELYIFDEQFHDNNMELLKKHTFRDNCIISSIKSTDNSVYNFVWVETASLDNNELNIKRNWIENGIQKECKQIFIRE